MPTSSSLLRERDFLRLWAAQSVSDFGARIAREGLPITAVLTLAAGPGALGLLAAVRGAAVLVVGLSTGGFVDRRRRRPVMIAVDLARAAVLAILPLAAWLHVLSLPLVLVVTAAVAGLSVLFDIANHAYLPTLVRRDQIGEANSRTSATEGLAEMAGPALAGVLFQWLSAPVALILNALTYLASAAALGGIAAAEPAAQASGEDTGVVSGLVAGGRTILAHPVARVLLFTSAVSGLFGGVFSALYILFILRGLGLGPVILGAGIACGGLGALAGSFSALRFARRLGVGPAIILTSAASALGTLVLLLAPHERAGATACLFASQVLGDFFGVIPVILGASLLQASLAPTVLGRVRAVFQSASGSTAVIGSLAGGALGAAIGPREAMQWAILGLLTGPAIAAFTPLRRVRDMPA
jgi:predicted MFS family arabinose efflux permease